MEDSTTRADQQLAALDELIRMRVNHRLRGWPLDKREDVMQDVRLKMLIVLRKMGDAIERPAAYCQRTIDHTINDSLRALAAERRFVLLDEDLIHQDDPADIAAVNEAVAGLTWLTPKQKRLLDLWTSTGSTAAVAEHLGVSTQTASERLSRLRRAIRNRLTSEAA